jgi:hypothetical protein
MLAGGVSIKELVEFLAHKDEALTLRVYVHLLPNCHDRTRQVKWMPSCSGPGPSLTEYPRNRAV